VQPVEGYDAVKSIALEILDSQLYKRIMPRKKGVVHALREQLNAVRSAIPANDASSAEVHIPEPRDQ
jgi:hypothetical protein